MARASASQRSEGCTSPHEGKVGFKTQGLAVRALNRAVRAGNITRPMACEKCARTDARLDGHHEDYTRALDVVWLCRSCHQLRHAEINRALKARPAGQPSAAA